MYYPYFVTYIVIGLTLGAGVFFWALRNGQFKDQGRARYLPLEDEVKTRSGKTSGAHRIEVIALSVLAAAGLGLSAAVLIFSLIQSRPVP